MTIQSPARSRFRAETFNRIERAKFSPSVRTVEKIDRALREAEAKGVKGP